jgi:1-acyl-sn-glycerol-3-phosphate acyltransferase
MSAIDTKRPKVAKGVTPPPGEPPAPEELWETEEDTVTIHQIGAIVDRLRGLPGVGALLDLFGEQRMESLRGTIRALLTQDADRDVDKFGYDAQFVDRLLPLARFVHDHYFRVETTGVEHIPATGRALIVANHSGTLPFDGVMVVTTTRLNHPVGRQVRAMVENFLYHFPYLGLFMARTGAVRACQENARLLLDNDEVALVFPEGVKGIGKLYRKRYKLQRFGRGGAIRLAMATGAPIIPCSIVGAEESMPLMSKLSWLARPLGLPYMPITPTLPALGPLGLIPYPTKWFIDFGEPIDVSAETQGGGADRLAVNRLNVQVRQRIQDMIDARLEHRQSVFFG